MPRRRDRVVSGSCSTARPVSSRSPTRRRLRRWAPHRSRLPLRHHGRRRLAFRGSGRGRRSRSSASVRRAMGTALCHGARPRRQRRRSVRCSGAMIESAFPILSTPDLARALSFYEDILGGRVTYRFPDDGDAHYVGLELGSSHLGIGADPELDAETGNERFSLWVYVDDCDAVVETSRAGRCGGPRGAGRSAVGRAGGAGRRPRWERRHHRCQGRDRAG